MSAVTGSSTHANEVATQEPCARWELLRALGAALTSPPPANHQVTAALGLPEQTGADHTDAFVLTAPPHAAIHLGPEGQLGGEGLDRVSGFWRALGLTAPEDADHLGVLLMLYAELGEAEQAASGEPARAQLRRASVALLHEHLWSWAPGYLTAVINLDISSVTAWAEITFESLQQEVRRNPPPRRQPLALRTAPLGLQATDSLDEVLDAMVAPVRSGLVLTRYDLRAAAATLGVGYRQGERRYVLKAMLEQDKPATLGWLASHARTWCNRHRRNDTTGPSGPGMWWATRAETTAQVVEAMARHARERSQTP